MSVVRPDPRDVRLRAARAVAVAVVGTAVVHLLMAASWGVALLLTVVVALTTALAGPSRYGRAVEAVGAGAFSGLAAWLYVGLGLVSLPVALVGAALPLLHHRLEDGRG